MISVKNVKKYYKVAMREEGLSATFRHLFHRKYEVKKAVDDISFEIKEGEIVGFIGPNGAGKSTTIKMLSGILYPDSGEVVIDGFIPYKQRKDYVKNVGVVFGQKSQLQWDLPLIESFELLKYIYKVPEDSYRENLEKFTQLLDLGEFLKQPVRQLSLGQRMRGDIVAALLHAPKIVFFDEPTIGLDVVAKEKIRQFIRYMNETEHTTMIFTTHDMQDIEKVCNRLIIIDKGKMIYDGGVGEIKNKYASSKNVEMLLEDGTKKTIVFDTNKTPMNEVMEGLFSKFNIKDISIHEAEIDGIIRDIYEGGICADEGVC